MQQLREKIIKALIKRGLYNPHDVFQHEPEIYPTDNVKYPYQVTCVKWNTRSTRMSVYNARFDEKKNKWIFSSTKLGQGRIAHGEQMR